MITSTLFAIMTALVTSDALAAPAPKISTISPSQTKAVSDNAIQSAAEDFHNMLASCPALPPRTSPPTNVSDVRPDDISVVMAMGDSAIAGVNSRYINVPEFAIKTYRMLFKNLEFRGSSFATGADPDAFSVAQIINKFRNRDGNSPVIGFSHGNSSFEFCYGPICPSGSFLQPFNTSTYGLNAAQSGSWVTQHNLDNQFKYLDRHYKEIVGEPKVEPWKLMIYEHGFNNLCIGCNFITRALFFNADKFEKNVRYMVKNMRKRYTNMVIVLAGPFHMSQLYGMIQNNKVCKEIHKGFHFFCPCLFYNPKVNHPIMDKLATEYNRRLAKIAADYKTKGYKDFAVIYDPGMGSSNLAGATAEETISGHDCFHPTLQTHARFAAGLWNNLFVPSGQKKTFKLISDTQLRCPTADDRIAIQ